MGHPSAKPAACGKEIVYCISVLRCRRRCYSAEHRLRWLNQHAADLIAICRVITAAVAAVIIVADANVPSLTTVRLSVPLIGCLPLRRKLIANAGFSINPLRTEAPEGADAGDVASMSCHHVMFQVNADRSGSSARTGLPTA